MILGWLGGFACKTAKRSDQGFIDLHKVSAFVKCALREHYQIKNEKSEHGTGKELLSY